MKLSGKFTKLWAIVFTTLLLSFTPSAFGQDDAELEEPAKVEISEGSFKERPLDGVTIEALETYRNPKSSQLTFDLSLLPFNAYYSGFGIHGGYIWILDKTWAWEVLNASYVYSVEKGLTSELAQNYAVAPERIERIQFTGATNLMYYHSYGKFIFAKEYIRYFRSAFILGLGAVTTNKNNYIAGSLGWKFEVFVNEHFSWKIEARDLITAQSGVTNNVAFSLGTAYSF